MSALTDLIKDLEKLREEEKVPNDRKHLTMVIDAFSSIHHRMRTLEKEVENLKRKVKE